MRIVYLKGLGFRGLHGLNPRNLRNPRLPLCSLSDMPLLEFSLDIEDEIVFRALPVRSDQQSKWRLAEHALDDNPGIEPLYEVTQEIKVLFVLEDPKRPSRVFGRERGAAYEMQVMNF